MTWSEGRFSRLPERLRNTGDSALSYTDLDVGFAVHIADLVDAAALRIEALERELTHAKEGRP
ncbi:MAG: hypothetical protein AAFQ90_12705 [Pseudomonadota bacterium]